MTANLIGNEELRAKLAQLGREERLHPSMLFEGPDGVGKTSAAIWLARLVNCESDGAEAEPCGQCWSCRMIPEDRHPDVIRIAPDPEKATQIISVSQARDLVSQLRMKPYKARRRFVIIEPADTLTTEAANALLKTLEEPPSDTGFVLISSRPTQILATVRSRSQRIRFGPVADDKIRTWLESRGFEVFDGLLLDAGGGPGKALSIAECGEDTRIRIRAEFIGALGGSMDDLLAYGESLTKGSRSQWRPKVDLVLDMAEGLVRDLVLIRAGRDVGELANIQESYRLTHWAGVLGTGGTRALLAALASARADLRANVNGRLVMDTLLARWARALGPSRKVSNPPA